MKAPSAMERPAAAATRPAPMTTKRQAAMNSSSLRARATERIIGRSKSRPPITRAATPSTAGTKDRSQARG